MQKNWVFCREDQQFVQVVVRRFGYGDLRYEHMRVGFIVGRGKVWSEVTHIVRVQERMGVPTSSIHEPWIFCGEGLFGFAMARRLVR